MNGFVFVMFSSAPLPSQSYARGRASVARMIYTVSTLGGNFKNMQSGMDQREASRQLLSPDGLLQF